MFPFSSFSAYFSTNSPVHHFTPALKLTHPSLGRRLQYAAQAYRAALCDHGQVRPMSQRGNPYDNAMMESFMKTLNVERIYPMAFESPEACLSS